MTGEQYKSEDLNQRPTTGGLTMKLYGLEYRIWPGRKWRRCSLTMYDRHAIERQAELLAAQDKWSGWRVIGL